jgi:hypothetical protein
MALSKYNCTQQQLYAIGRAAWQNCNDRIADFTAFKAKYTALFITAKINAINDAEALPDDEQRKAVASLLREQLSVKAAECRDSWQRLKLYIEEAYPENEQQIQLNAAGAAHYDGAGKENWDSVKRLMLDGDAFITANTVALSAADNMPAGFPVAFATVKSEFETLYSNFINASLNTEVQTQGKITANNTVYTDLTSMLKDGQRIYKDDEAVRKLFTFDQLLNDIAGSGPAGIKGTVTDGTNPLEGVSVKIIGPNITAFTDEDGKYSFTLSAGTYSLLLTKPGFQDQQIDNIVLEPGVTKTVDVVMIAV